MKDSVVGIRECPQEPSRTARFRKLTSDGVDRILWEKLPSGEWVEIRREKLRRTLQ